MKPKFFLPILLLSLFSFSAFSQNKGGTESVRFSENITSLVIENDLSVVLTEGGSSEVVIDGRAKDLEATVTDGHLTLAAKTPFAAGTKVYVPAGFLSKIYLNGKGKLSSESVLTNRNIRIYLAAEARIHVKSTGNVTVEAIDDIQFVKGR